MTAINLSDLPNKQDKVTATGLLLGQGAGAIVAATAGTDYLTPTGSASGLTGLTSGQVTTALGYTPASSSGTPPQKISTNTTASNGGSYVLTAACTLTLPATPSAGWSVTFVNKFAGTSTIGRNGSNIESTASDMTNSLQNMVYTLVYVDATYGWIILN